MNTNEKLREALESVYECARRIFPNKEEGKEKQK